jgi:hypothetical protein
MSFLEHMYEVVGKEIDTISESEKSVPEPKKQEQICVHVMNCDMNDNFFSIGNADFFTFLSQFVNNEYKYHTGGAFGSSRTAINEDKNDWYDTFKQKAKSAKKTKTQYYIDETDPMHTIKETLNLMRVAYPDLIVAF